MNSKIVDVKCIKENGKLFNFPLTVGKVYHNSLVVWTEEAEEDGAVTVINDFGEKEHYSMKYFEIVE